MKSNLQKQTDKKLDLDERDWWDSWNTSHRFKDNNDEISAELFAHVALIVRGFSQVRMKRVLEVACGTGTLSRQLEFSSYHGLDVSPAAIAMASSMASQLSLPDGMERPTYEVADIHEWSLPSRSFDLAICVDAVAYFRDQKLALRKMASALNASGQLILTTINPFVYDRIRRTAQAPLKEGAISHWLGKEELHTLIASAGMQLKHSYTIMPRGNMGILRIINSARLNENLGHRGKAWLRSYKEKLGLGQYRVVVATKPL